MDLQEVKSRPTPITTATKKQTKRMAGKQGCLFQTDTLHIGFIDVSLY